MTEQLLGVHYWCGIKSIDKMVYLWLNIYVYYVLHPQRRWKMGLSNQHIKRLILVLLVLILSYDLYWIMCPDYNINRHIPFLCPICLAIVLIMIKQIEHYESRKYSHDKKKDNTQL